MELAVYGKETVEVLERGTNLSRIRLVNTNDDDFSVKSENLLPFPQKKPQPMIFRDGRPYKGKTEALDEICEWVLAQAADWITTPPLAPTATEKFATLTLDNKPFFNQVMLDMLTVVSRQHPGKLIEGGHLIFKKAPKGSGCLYEFKARSCATPEEIRACEAFAVERSKFVFVPSL